MRETCRRTCRPVPFVTPTSVATCRRRGRGILIRRITKKPSRATTATAAERARLAGYIRTVRATGTARRATGRSSGSHTANASRVTPGCVGPRTAAAIAATAAGTVFSRISSLPRLVATRATLPAGTTSAAAAGRKSGTTIIGVTSTLAAIIIARATHAAASAGGVCGSSVYTAITMVGTHYDVTADY